MEYNFSEIEKKWHDWWNANEIYKVSNDSSRPKYYVLDMFPYPSGAGLHVGHPLGYIASDIYARYKRLKGFNVLHPMGYDAFGLPAEQYAIEHGIHPAVSTAQNIQNFRKQMDKIAFSFDWSRQVNTSDPAYYKWTQWIFLQLFKSFYDRQTKKAESIDVLVASFEKDGNKYHPFPNQNFQFRQIVNGQQSADNIFTAEEWNSFSEKQQQDILMEYRLAYCGYGEVNWCEALGTVLANDEVVNGVSERGGYPVVKKKLRQWYLRITEYADRLLEGLETVDFSEAMKEMQTNWIGKSYGAEIDFEISDSDKKLRVFTTRPDTIFGVDFMVVAPEHELVEEITTPEQKQEVEAYIKWVKSRSERERMAEKTISGAFTGAYAINPFDNREVPVYISEYVLAGYGTGAIMAVPCGDERDFRFAKHFDIEITNILGEAFNGKEANPTKDAELVNSNFLTGMLMRDAIKVAVQEIEDLGYGKAKVNYKMRDAAFSRQRYWGEPFPIVWKDGIAYPLDESELPLELPKVENYKPGPEGEGPLANVKEWALIPFPSPQVEKGASVPQADNSETGDSKKSDIPKYSVYTPMQYELAKEMRKNHTEAEGLLWEELRNNKIGVKFRRQHPVDAYITDFIALHEKLIVEVDGGYHENDEQKQYDENRANVLKEIGFNIIRFNNDEVINNINKVVKRIKEELQKNKPSQKKAETSQIPLSTSGEGLGVRETNTMPGYAGSSWYFLRYMDPHNDETFCDKKASDYWNQVDVYVGGTEHAVGHLLYSRMWTKFLFDLGLISFDEPYKKLLNQGMIQGSSRFVYRVNLREFGSVSFDKNFNNSESLNKRQIFISKGYRDSFSTPETQQLIKNHFLKDIQGNENIGLITLKLHNELSEIHVDVNIVDGVELNIEKFKQWRNGEYANAEFILEDGKYICGVETEKMSKSKFNTVDPSDLVDKYGADTFRMYEMFLGPVEQSKPWDTKGIEGVHRFLRKFWRLFFDEVKGKIWNDDKATEAELKILHKAIKKIEEDTERFSYNTAVSAFMVCTNELADLKCHKKEILQPLVIMLSSYAPFIAEELYHALGNEGSVLDAVYPTFDAKYLVESSKEYPISVNGKLRTTINISLDASQKEVESIVLQNDVIQKWLDGKAPKKIIFVKNKMVNVVI